MNQFNGSAAPDEFFNGIYYEFKNEINEVSLLYFNSDRTGWLDPAKV